LRVMTMPQCQNVVGESKGKEQKMIPISYNEKKRKWSSSK